MYHYEWRGEVDDSMTFTSHYSVQNFKTEELSYWRRCACTSIQHRRYDPFKCDKTFKYNRVIHIHIDIDREVVPIDGHCQKRRTQNLTEEASGLHTSTCWMASGAANQINAFWSRMVQACVFVTSIGSMNIISHTLSYVAVEISSAKYDVGVQKKTERPQHRCRIYGRNCRRIWRQVTHWVFQQTIWQNKPLQNLGLASSASGRAYIWGTLADLMVCFIPTYWAFEDGFQSLVWHWKALIQQRDAWMLETNLSHHRGQCMLQVVRLLGDCCWVEDKNCGSRDRPVLNVMRSTQQQLSL